MFPSLRESVFHGAWSVSTGLSLMQSWSCIQILGRYLLDAIAGIDIGSQMLTRNLSSPCFNFSLDPYGIKQKADNDQKNQKVSKSEKVKAKRAVFYTEQKNDVGKSTESDWPGRFTIVSPKLEKKSIQNCRSFV